MTSSPATGPIRFGVTLPGGSLDDASLVEDLGFDSLWQGEHIIWHGPTLDATVALAAFAARTSRITLGTSVLLLPLRHPTAVAKSFATLDVVSGGRTVLGIGVGGENPAEFAACGIPYRERGARTTEAIEVIRRLWGQPEASFEGRFTRFEGIRIEPRPLQPGGPPIWVGGRSDAALRRAARFGDGWLPYLIDPDQYRSGWQGIQAEAREAGRNLDAFTPAHLIFTYLDDDLDAARAMAARRLGRAYRQPFEDLVDRFCALGPPEEFQRKLQQFIDAGARHLVLSPLCPYEDVIGQLARYATDVIPAWRS
ncbi:MAG TPA: LLM class flavin-dependent oxidoreductase [Dehalococcoidia bacterium]|nr:LLM class flavin-dependent oxidoreductase [Dehalococcoidia bacterium]